jgi:hypothetical protein
MAPPAHSPPHRGGPSCSSFGFFFCCGGLLLIIGGLLLLIIAGGLFGLGSRFRLYLRSGTLLLGFFSAHGTVIGTASTGA